MLKKTPTLSVVLLAACACLSSCYYPFSYQSTEAIRLESPYRFTDVSVNHGTLAVHLSDPSIKDAAFKGMQLVSAVLVTDSGKELPLTLWLPSYGDGVTFNFRLNEAGFDGDHFKLRVVVCLDGKNSTITGEFSVHGHLKIVNLEDISG